MNVTLLVATQRGYRFAQRFFQHRPDDHTTLFTFRETPWEPPFFDDIKQLAMENGATFIEARQVDKGNARFFWSEQSIDLMICVNWRYLVPQSIFSQAILGAFVYHDSYLPEYRGFSPTVWAMINGEDHTGVTLLHMSDDVDAGDIVDQQKVPIHPHDTIAEVMERVTQAYLTVLDKNINILLEGNVPGYPQNHDMASYTCTRLPEDNRINWAWNTNRVYNLIRAVTQPYPGAYTFLEGQKLIIWKARPTRDFPAYIGRTPGRVVEVGGKGCIVLTGDSGLLIQEVQLNGGVPQPASNILTSIKMTLC